jgi:hypothetical protein
MARAGFAATSPLIRTFPADTTPAAMERDLKNRACHNHLSNRIVSRLSVNPF